MSIYHKKVSASYATKIVLDAKKKLINAFSVHNSTSYTRVNAFQLVLKTHLNYQIQIYVFSCVKKELLLMKDNVIQNVHGVQLKLVIFASNVRHNAKVVQIHRSSALLATILNYYLNKVVLTHVQRIMFLIK